MSNHNIGSISSGTLRTQDLLESFLWDLRHQKPLQREHRKLCTRIQEKLDKALNGEFGEQDAYFTDETADWDLEELTNALQEYAPAYFYFGTHPGDGADFGYWLSESFEQDFDGLKVSDLSEVPRGYTGEVLHVNDHGNMTLYAYSRGRGRELWGIV